MLKQPIVVPITTDLQRSYLPLHTRDYICSTKQVSKYYTAKPKKMINLQSVQFKDRAFCNCINAKKNKNPSNGNEDKHTTLVLVADLQLLSQQQICCPNEWGSMNCITYVTS